MHAKALQLGAQRLDNEPAAEVGRPSATVEAAVGSASIRDLADIHNALSARAIQRATATIASIDRALSDDEQRRKAKHEAAALELMRKGIFEALAGSPVGPALECITGGAS